MTRLDEIISEQFFAWERRGRGWNLYPEPVALEPPFRPFEGYMLPSVEDDGRIPTFLNGLVTALSRSFQDEPSETPLLEAPEELSVPPFDRGEIQELQILLPPKFKVDGPAFSSLISSLDVCREPISFEVVGNQKGTCLQVAAEPFDCDRLKRQLNSLFPDIALVDSPSSLEDKFKSSQGYATVVDFGLEEEFMLPLRTDLPIDPLSAIFSALGDVESDELAAVQVLVQSTTRPWAHSALRSLRGGDGKVLFTNHPRLITGSKEKFSLPLFAVALRLLTKASTGKRAWSLMHELADSLRAFANPDGNALLPLDNEDYPIEEHVLDFVRRQSRRTGMLLNSAELLTLVHFPSTDVRCDKLVRQLDRTKAAPTSSSSRDGLYLGENQHLFKTQTVSLSLAERTRHIHIIGASGTGKSTLLFNLLQQDIENNQGVALLDPHGDLVERVLTIIPPHRVHDVILLDPADEEFFIGFNILSAHSDLEKNLLASDLVSIFQRLSTSWGDQMGSVLQNAILAFLESDRGGTIADLRRFLIEPQFRTDFLSTVRDPEVQYYWKKGFSQLTGNKSIGPILTRLESFLAPKPIRYMVAQRENKIDFSDILDTGKILLAKLPQGQIGRENSFLLGSLLVAKFQQLTMGRQARRADSRRPFFFYIDEFHNFITPSMAEILSGARKYNVGLVLAHQELRQLERDREVASAVLSNCCTRIVFRVGDSDARTLAEGFEFFEARDIQNLGIGRAICRVGRATHDFNLSILLPAETVENGEETRQRVTEASRNRYGTPRSVVEADLRNAGGRETQPAAEKPQVASGPRTDNATPQEEVDSKERPASHEGRPAALSNQNDDLRAFKNAEEIKTRIIQEAGSLGFSYQEEERLPDLKRVDLVLRRESLILACEISATTSAEHEAGNIQKCVRQGYPRIFHICDNRSRREQLLTLIRSLLSDDEILRVQCLSVADFIALLKRLPPSSTEELPATPPKSTPPPQSPQLTPDEQKSLEQDMLAELRRKLKRKKS